jgi:hypothetical protein
LPGWPGGSVDVAVLAELRAIRAEIHDLAERVGQSATRDELHDYVRREEFDAHTSGHQRVLDGWRGWVPVGLAALAVLWNVFAPYVHFGPR